VNWSVAVMNDEVLALLNVHEYFSGLSEQTLLQIVAAARTATYSTGELVHDVAEPVSSVRFVLRGRLKAVKLDVHGRETPLMNVERGSQFGMMLGILQEQMPVRIFALEPTTILEITHETAMELTATHVDLRRLWLRTYAGGLRRQFFGTSKPRTPTILALVHESPTTRPLARRLLDRLSGLGEALGVFSDTCEGQAPVGGRFRSLNVDGTPLALDEIRRQAGEWQDKTRIVYDVGLELGPERLEMVLKLADRVVYFVPAYQAEMAASRLQSLDVAGRGLREKLYLSWVLEPGRNAAPLIPGLRDWVARDFKIAEGATTPPRGRSLDSGMERLVHELRGVRIGLALGGGAARGMAHLGVLKVLEENGIVVDEVAGTSAGALTGVVYASGLDPTYCAERFSADLRPSWLFRHLPKGSYWYLLYQYRRGHFDPMLRRYLKDWSLEQLPIPCLAVSVDLVSGQPVVRDRGDAVHAVLESINLPVMSVPIVREGMALIDGGLVNNIPADVLVSRGCNFVIAVSVTAKMEHRFCDINPGTPTPRGRKPSTFQTLLRSLLVQNHSLNGIGVQPADVVIEPDVRGFELSEFMRAGELAAEGERAAVNRIPKVKQLLARLDSRLFPFQPSPVGDR
jgi:predicted acylesterase/phospholipase RssA/CRP-like cAMP-binding protein